MSATLADADWDYGLRDTDLVYAVLWDAALIFVPRQWGEHVLDYRSGLASETWGELIDSLTPESYKDILESSWGDDDEPAPDEPFDYTAMHS